MEKYIKDKIVDELVRCLKESKRNKLLEKRDKLSTENKDLKKAFDLLEKLPVKELDNCTIIPIGRLINDTCSDYGLSDLTYFYFLVLEEGQVNLYMCDLKDIDELSQVYVNAPFYKKKKYDKLVDWISELQNHPDFLFEDLEAMKELLKVNFLSKKQNLC